MDALFKEDISTGISSTQQSQPVQRSDLNGNDSYIVSQEDGEDIRVMCNGSTTVDSTGVRNGNRAVEGAGAQEFLSGFEEPVQTRVEATQSNAPDVMVGTLLSGDEGSTDPTSTNLRVVDAHELSNGRDSEESSMHRGKGGDGSCDSDSLSPATPAVLTVPIGSSDALLGSESLLNCVSALYPTDVDATEAAAVDEVEFEAAGDPASMVIGADAQRKPKQFDDTYDGNHGKSAGKDLRVGQIVAVIEEERGGVGAEVEVLHPVVGERKVAVRSDEGQLRCDRATCIDTVDGDVSLCQAQYIGKPRSELLLRFKSVRRRLIFDMLLQIICW